MAIPLTAREPVVFHPPSKPDATLLIRVPTPYERDAFASALVRGGVVHYTRAQIRELMLAGVLAVFGAERYEDNRVAIEEVWSAADAFNQARQRRAEKEIELREKAVERWKGIEPSAVQVADLDKEIEEELEKITPSVVVGDAKRLAVAALQQEVTTRFQPLHQAFADLAEQKTKRDWLTIETYVTGWEQSESLPDTPDGNGKGGITRPEAEYLRTHLGADAFEKVGDFIFALHSLDGDEEKNLASLLASMSAQDGSTQPESKVSSRIGTSETDASGETPVTE